MPITISIHGESAAHALDELREFAAGLPGAKYTIAAADAGKYVGEPQSADPYKKVAQDMTATEAAAMATEEIDTRPYGQAPEGKARRTKAEMAEDDEFAKLIEATGVPLEKLNEVIATHGRAAAREGLEARLPQQTEDKPSISTGENRVGPEDEPEAEEQDAADEAAEVEAARKDDKPLTIDDLKNAMGDYVKAFGLAETQEDGAKLFADALGTPPEGNAFWKVSLVAAQGQEALRKAIAAWEAAIATGERYKAKGA